MDQRILESLVERLRYGGMSRYTTTAGGLATRCTTRRHRERLMTAAAQPWTLERICEVLQNPKVKQMCIGEINRAQIHEIAKVFAKWQGVAEKRLASVERAKAARAEELAGRPVPGNWTDCTDEVIAEAARIKASKAA